MIWNGTFSPTRVDLQEKYSGVQKNVDIALRAWPGHWSCSNNAEWMVSQNVQLKNVLGQELTERDSLISGNKGCLFAWHVIPCAWRKKKANSVTDAPLNVFRQSQELCTELCQRPDCAHSTQP